MAHRAIFWLFGRTQSESHCAHLASTVRQVEHGSLCHPPANPPPPLPQGTSKVSWTAAQINLTSDPAGVVSGSAGQRGDKPVFVQQKLRVVLYLKRAIITSVTGVLTGRRSCRGAVHHGTARPRNRWLASSMHFFFFFFCLSAHCLHMADRLGAVGSGFFMTRPNGFYSTAAASSFVTHQEKKDRSLAYFRKANEISEYLHKHSAGFIRSRVLNIQDHSGLL